MCVFLPQNDSLKRTLFEDIRYSSKEMTRGGCKMAIYVSQSLVISLHYVYSKKKRGCFIPVVEEFLVAFDPEVVAVVV